MRRMVYGLIVLALILAACGEKEPTATAPPPPTVTVTAAPIAPPPPTEEPVAEAPIYLAIIWHQHQPVYFKDPATNIYDKPWVRNHAAKDYVDMAAILKGYPDIHATFNLTPSLIRQIDDLLAGAKDLPWVMTEKPADQLSDEDKAYIVQRFLTPIPKSSLASRAIKSWPMPA